MTSTRDQLATLAQDPALTLDGAALGLLRFVLQRASEDPDKVKVGDVAAVLEATARVRLAGGNAGTGGLDQLLDFMRGGDNGAERADVGGKEKRAPRTKRSSA